MKLLNERAIKQVKDDRKLLLLKDAGDYFSTDSNSGVTVSSLIQMRKRLGTAVKT